MGITQLATYQGLRVGRVRFTPLGLLVIDVIVSFAICCLSSYIAWNDWRFWTQPSVLAQAGVVIALLAGGKWFLLRREYRVPTDRVALACLWVIVLYAGLALGIVFLRPYYSRSFLLASFLLLLTWQFIEVLPYRAVRAPRLAAVPGPLVEKLMRVEGLNLTLLTEPLIDSTIEGLVVDLHMPLSKEWSRFVAESAAMGLPVYHAASVYEAATAKVSLEHAHAGWLSALFNGNLGYLPLKRAIDILFVLLSLPIVIPLCLVIALLIRVDSGGPVLFWQDRVGQGGRVFRLVKFRTMRVDAERNGAQFARPDDDRVTRVGRVLRKYRLDELPQLWNVLKGEMSLIGPRPEQVEFARQFEEEIPFYRWRHRVKPGITGWAQVQQGYAAGVQDTMEKLEYDLYYVKHLSLWLDLKIALKTIVTIVTGFGAR